MSRLPRPSLAMVLFFPIALLILIVGIWQFWLTSTGGRAATSAVTRQLRTQSNRELSRSSNAFLEVNENILAQNVGYIQDIAYQNLTMEHLGRYFLNQIKVHGHLTYISFGSREGWYVGASRNPADGVVRLALCKEPGTPFIHYELDPGDLATMDLLRLKESNRSAEPYDPRLRPWYIQALERPQGPSWYPVYQYTSDWGLGTGISQAVHDAAGNLVGVATADIALAELSDLLESNPIGKTGYSVIVEASGKVIAGSKRLVDPGLMAGTGQRRSIADLGNKEIASAWETIRTRADTLREGEFQVQTGSSVSFVDWSVIRKTGLEDWYIIQVLPARDYFEEFDRAETESLVVIFAVLLALALVVLFLTYRILKPLEHLGNKAKLLAEGENPDFGGPSLIREIDHLNKVFSLVGTELKSSRERLESAMSSSRFEVLELQNRAVFAAQNAASIAHEIRTPLSNSKLATEQLKYLQTELEEKLRGAGLTKRDLDTFLLAVDESSSIALVNIGRGIDIARHFQNVMVNQLGEERQTINLANQVQEILFGLKPILRRNGIALESEVDTTLEMEMDPGLLAHVIANMVTNAVHHAFSGFERREKIIRVDARAQGDYALIQISDNGRGMVQDVRARAFEPLFTTGGAHGGSGLGLAMIKRMVEQKALGTIELESTPGQGSTFTVRLPLKPGEEYETGPAVPEAPGTE